jgi:hypothetical protein
MRVLGISLATLLLAVGRLNAGQPPGKLIDDNWEVAFLQGSRAGFIHTQVWETIKNGHKLYSTLVRLHLTVKRNTDVIQLRMDTGTSETARGKVLSVLMRQYLGKDKELLITGKVVDKELQLLLDNKKPLKSAPWDDDVLGLYQQKKMLAQRKLKPGDEFTFRSFEPAVLRAIRNDVRVGQFEEVELHAGKEHKKLLRVEVRPEKLENVQLPTLLLWLDDKYVPLRSEVSPPGLGRVILYRSDKISALATAEVATLTDIGISQQIRLKQRIERPYETRTAVYRVTVAKDDDVASTFSRDKRQQVKNVRGNTFDLHVRAPSPSAVEPEDRGAKPSAEFTQSSYFITSDDNRVKQLAREAVGTEKDPWLKALKIEKWVNRHMTTVSDEAMATADHVARTLRGDCTEYAMLTAAMCRAQGVPAKTAVGLIYADVESGPVFAFHMWTEVWLRGEWLPIDATLGRGYVGATHLKITDHSWSDTRTLTPLFPLLRVLGRVNIEVVHAQ